MDTIPRFQVQGRLHPNARAKTCGAPISPIARWGTNTDRSPVFTDCDNLEACVKWLKVVVALANLDEVQYQIVDNKNKIVIPAELFEI